MELADKEPQKKRLLHSVKGIYTNIIFQDLTQSTVIERQKKEFNCLRMEQELHGETP